MAEDRTHEGVSSFKSLGRLLAVVPGVIGLTLLAALACEGALRAPPESDAPEQPSPGSLPGAAEPAGPPGIANPASEKCVAEGGALDILQGDGGQYGVCVFADGSRCEEWRFFRGECAPGACTDASGTCD
jgi:hypothetical protein